jgi:anti-sigma regulatory factor (Ser/Thr protein kinase)
MSVRVFPVADPSRVGEARREAALLAGRVGIGDVAASKLALVVTELGTNLLKHAREGELVLRGLGPRGARRAGVEVVAIDRGPGMQDVGRCLSDGYSTAGSAGTGLGAVARAASIFDVHSDPSRGTVVLAQVCEPKIGPRRAPAPAEAALLLDFGVISVPKAGESVCGDGWAVVSRGPRSRLTVVDGLGHGSEAAAAAREAERVFAAQGAADPWPSLPALLQACHVALATTRGAAMAVAEIDGAAGRLRYAGIGNIASSVLTAGGQHGLASHNGTVGHHLRKVQVFEQPWPEEATLVMTSDGISSRFGLEAHPGLLTRRPGLVAGVVYRDFTRQRDDATVLVARETHD